MKRTIVNVGVVVAFLFVASTESAHGQIKVVKKPAPKVGPDAEVVYNSWTSSWGLRDDPPNEYPLGIATHKTEAEAVAAAKAHIAGTAGNGAHSVTHYFIEGEPSVLKASVERVSQATDLLARLKEAKEAVDHAKKVEKGEASVLKAKQRKLGDTIKEYKDMVAQSYRQAVEAKKTLTGGTSALADAKFRQVNGLIDKYNREVQDFKAVMGRDANLGFSLLDRAQPPTVEKLEIPGRWRTGRNEWVFGTDGSFQIAGTRNRGQWKRTADGIAIKYSGASVWINLTFVGETLVDQKGFIGRAQLKKARR